MRKQFVLVAGFLALSAAFAALFLNAGLKLGDPDRYYHFALSRQMVESGQAFLRSVPQVEDLGWGESFVDKEFLFHQFTALGYRVAGDEGVVWSVTLMVIATILALLLFAARHLPPAGAVAVVFFTFTCPLFLARLLLLRPHVLAILAFVLMTITVLSRRPIATAFAVFFFTFSYHAFYLPLICLSFLVPLSFLDTKENAAAWRKVAAYGFVGCVCAILANPYFPASIEIAVIHARIPSLVRGELLGLNWGAEHSPLASDNYFEALAGAMLVLLAAAFVLGRDLKDKTADVRRGRVPFLYLFAVAGFFFVLSFQSRRAGEYLAPAAGFLAIFLLQRLKSRPVLVTVIPLVLGLAEARICWKVLTYEPTEVAARRLGASQAALAELPPEAKGAKIYNTEWDFSPFIYYLRPDLRFLDILDPSLLYFAAPGPFRARDDLRKGILGDPYGMIRNAAKAEYVFTNDGPLNEALRADPGFQQLYPKGALVGTLPALFRLRPEPPAEFVRNLEVSQLGRYNGKELPKPGSGADSKLFELARSSYLDLAAAMGKRSSAEDAALYCGLVKLPAAEVAARAGAAFVGLGGGQGIELFRNGKPLFRTFPRYSEARSVQVLVPLSPPLAKSDRLEALVCSPSNARFWGLSVSLWTRKQLDSACAWKTEKTGPPSQLARGPVAFMGSQTLTCLGPVAAPMGP